MGEKQDRLSRHFQNLGITLRPKSVKLPTSVDAQTSLYASDILETYRALGGVQPQFSLRVGVWDVEIAGFGVELDEQLHFNSYRAITLESPLYEKLPLFPLETYRVFCDTYRGDCLKAGSYGGKWSNPSCEKQFGPAAPPGNLSGNGAPRWKQRAFYDFVKDLSPLLMDIKVARLSIWDTVMAKGRKLLIKDALHFSDLSVSEALYDLVKSRIQGKTPQSAKV